MIIIIPLTINEIPPKRWLFFHAVSFFILHTLLSPTTEFIRSFGIMLPNILNELKSRLQIVINKDPLLTKTFDNVFFSGEFDDVRKMMQVIKFTTKTQEGTIFKDNTEVNNPIEQREDTFRFAVGREKTSVDDMSLPGRMKGKYMICDYIINCNDQHNFRLPNINTTYRYSMV